MMNTLPLIAFDALSSPNELTQELAILLGVIIFTYLYASFKLRSLFGVFGFMLMMITLIITIFTNLPLMWFWLAVVAESFVIILAMVEYTKHRG